MASTESIAKVTAVFEALPRVVGREEGEEEGSMVARVVTCNDEGFKNESIQIFYLIKKIDLLHLLLE